MQELYRFTIVHDAGPAHSDSYRLRLPDGVSERLSEAGPWAALAEHPLATAPSIDPASVPRGAGVVALAGSMLGPEAPAVDQLAAELIELFDPPETVRAALAQLADDSTPAAIATALGQLNTTEKWVETWEGLNDAIVIGLALGRRTQNSWELLVDAFIYMSSLKAIAERPENLSQWGRLTSRAVLLPEVLTRRGIRVASPDQGFPEALRISASLDRLDELDAAIAECGAACERGSVQLALTASPAAHAALTGTDPRQPDDVRIDRALATLGAERRDLMARLGRRTTAPGSTARVVVTRGGAVVTLGGEPRRADRPLTGYDVDERHPLHSIVERLRRRGLPYESLLLTWRVRPSPSRLTPTGIQDLLVVRRRLLGYRPVEISHIENVATGETRERTHERSVEHETLFVTERETRTSEETDLQSTAKTLLASEIQRQQDQALALEGRVRVSYRGPTQVVAEAGARFEARSQEVARVAQEHSQEVTQRAVRRTEERVLERTERRLREHVREANLHRFESVGAESRSVVYQWLRQVDLAAIYCYGQRFVYEVVVPEPAALLLSLASGHAGAVVEAPAPAHEVFEDLTLTNVEDHLERILEHFDIAETLPPKPQPRWISGQEGDAHGGTGEAAGNHARKAFDLTIPSGWEAREAVVSVTAYQDHGDYTPKIAVTVADYALNVRLDSFVNPDAAVSELLPGGGERRDSTVPNARAIVAQVDFTEAIPGGDGDKVTCAFIADDFHLVEVSVALRCEPTEQAFAEWRAEIYRLIADAYRRQVELYRQAAVAAAAKDPGTTGLDEVTNHQAADLRRIERDELKRATIALIRNAPIDLSLVEEADFGEAGKMPVTDLDEHERHVPELLFLEQAFEWEHLDAVLYPYFWGRRSTWRDRIASIEGGDAPFREFLRAGAARVRIPVRPGFEAAVNYYMWTGDPWMGGPVPRVGDSLFVSWIEEKLEQLGAPDVDEKPYMPDGEPIRWEIEQPTELVIIRTGDADDDARLPRWEPTWAPVRDPDDPLRGWASTSGPVPEA